MTVSIAALLSRVFQLIIDQEDVENLQNALTKATSIMGRISTSRDDTSKSSIGGNGFLQTESFNFGFRERTKQSDLVVPFQIDNQKITLNTLFMNVSTLTLCFHFYSFMQKVLTEVLLLNEN